MTSQEGLRKHKNNSFINIAVIALGFVLVSFRESLGLPLEIGLFVVSLVVLVRAADVFTDMAVLVGERLGLSKLNTGILIIAIGTSAPELFASIAAALQNQPEMVVGNVLGTVIANCLLGIGIATLFARQALDVHPEVLATQMTIFLVSLLLVGMSLYDGNFSRAEGAVLLIVLVFYLRYNILYTEEAPIELPREMHEAIPEERNTKTQPMTMLTVLLLINLTLLFISGEFVVSSLSNGAEAMGLSSAKLATSLLAIGTSIPEIATAIMLVRKNNADSLFGEILGSNIFDFLGIFGIIAIVKPIVMSGPLLNFLLISALVTFILLFVVMNDRKVRQIEGIAMLALFAGFLLQLGNI